MTTEPDIDAAVERMEAALLARDETIRGSRPKARITNAMAADLRLLLSALKAEREKVAEQYRALAVAGSALMRLDRTNAELSDRELDARDLLAEAAGVLEEAALQIDYLHERGRPTGSGAAVASRLRTLSAKLKDRQQ